jgi:hypothetical protein
MPPTSDAPPTARAGIAPELFAGLIPEQLDEIGAWL